jgi:PIN domain nuclease of toxin-antitoxin system
VKLLLDTHTLLWSMSSNPRLSPKAAAAIRDRKNEIYASVICIWESATKHRQGRLPEAAVLLSDPELVLARMGFSALSVSLHHARLGGSLASPHKDPFDRMLAAQALLEGLTLVSADGIFDSMLVPRLW